MKGMMNGIWSAVLTPVDANFAPDAPRALAYYRDLLEQGCDGINLLGTTGEAMSFDAAQRMEFMEAVAAGGLPLERVMAGTGAASLHDAVQLTRRAFACGFAAALVLPPFFYRDAGDDGILKFFEAVLSRANAPSNRVLLYNFPRMSGITFRAGLVDRLLREFPGAIAGMKDSSNDSGLQNDILAHHPGFAIFPGSERDLRAARERGAAGCISGSVALWPRLARDVWSSRDDAKSVRLAKLRDALEGVPFIPAVRYLTAKTRKDEAWQRAMPPIVPLTAQQRKELDRAVGPLRLLVP